MEAYRTARIAKPALICGRLLHVSVARRASAGNAEHTGESPGHGSRRLLVQASRPLRVVMYSKAAHDQRMQYALAHRQHALARLDDAKRMTKVNIQAKILEQYCGSKSYAPMIPEASTRRLLRRPRIERDLVGMYKPVRLRRSAVVEVEDPCYPRDRLITHNRQLPLTTEQRLFLRNEQVFYVPDEVDDKNLPPYLKVAPIEHFLHIRIAGALVVFGILLSWYWIFIQSAPFNEELKWLRDGYRDFLKRLFPVDFLNDEILDEFQERERVALEQVYNSPDEVVKRLEHDIKVAQTDFQHTVKYTYPPARATAPILSTPR